MAQGLGRGTGMRYTASPARPAGNNHFETLVHLTRHGGAAAGSLWPGLRPSFRSRAESGDSGAGRGRGRFLWGEDADVRGKFQLRGRSGPWCAARMSGKAGSPAQRCWAVGARGGTSSILRPASPPLSHCMPLEPSIILLIRPWSLPRTYGAECCCVVHYCPPFSCGNSEPLTPSTHP